MSRPLDFDWDEAKAESNFRKHGISFRTASGIFADPDHVVIDTARKEDGEVRLKAIGTVFGRVLTLVFVMRGDVCRLISARRSNVSEEKAYGAV